MACRDKGISCDKKYTTLLDLARQAKVLSGETACFEGGIQVGIPFSGYPSGVDYASVVSLGIVDSEVTIFDTTKATSGGTTTFDVSNPLSLYYDNRFSGYSYNCTFYSVGPFSAATDEFCGGVSGYSRCINTGDSGDTCNGEIGYRPYYNYQWTNPLFSGATSGLTIPITNLSATTQTVGPFWTQTQTGCTGDHIIATQYTGYTIQYSFFDVFPYDIPQYGCIFNGDTGSTCTPLGTGYTTFQTGTTIAFSGKTNATQENFSASTIDYRGPLTYLHSLEDALIDNRLTTKKLRVTGGASSGTSGYVLTQVDSIGTAEWRFNSASATTNTFVTSGVLDSSDDLILTYNTAGTVPPIDLSGLKFSGGSGNCITDLYITNRYGCSTITEHDSIQHVGSSATGINSIAWGTGTTASGDYSHAEGFLTQAIGNGSHAEGSGSIANNSASHAEGVNSIASNTGAHAEGAQTTASGPYSHSEGSGTTASGDISHAEGAFSQATGDYSHAEGWSSDATEWAAHSEGQSTIASGEISHAEGDNTTASARASHSEGAFTRAIGDWSHSGGKGFNSSSSQIIASGRTSFIHFEQTTDTGFIGAAGDNSAILGGTDHNIGSGSTSSGIFGGTHNTIEVAIVNSSIIGGGENIIEIVTSGACGCPCDYYYNSATDLCAQYSDTLTGSTGLSVIAAADNGGYNNKGARFCTPGTYTTCWDNSGQQSSEHFLAGGGPHYGDPIAWSFWGDGVIPTGRLNAVGVWATLGGSPTNEWIGFSRCFNLPSDGQYLFALAGDNQIRATIDGVTIVENPWNADPAHSNNFNYWWVWPIDFLAGDHVINLEGKNNGSFAAFGCEIIGPFAADTYTTVPDFYPFTAQTGVDIYTANTVFSSLEVVGSTFDTSDGICPEGSYYDECSGSCLKSIECSPIITSASIIGGCSNTITNSAQFAAILGGSQNVIDGGIGTTIIGGQNITGTSFNTAYVPNLNINLQPDNDDALTQLLVRDVTDGTVKYRDASSISGGGGGTFTGNTSGECIGDIWVSNIHGCSPLTIETSLVIAGSGTSNTSVFKITDSSSTPLVNILNNGLLRIGKDAGAAVDTTNDNIFIGESSGEEVTIGFNNTLIGHEAGKEGSTALRDETFIGHQAGYLQEGRSNTFIGAFAGGNTVPILGPSSRDGQNITAIGMSAGQNLGPGANNNTFLGATAGRGVASGLGLIGSDNTGIGEGALLVLSTGSDNIAIGSGAGNKISTGSENTFIGNQSGGAASVNTTSSSNTALGFAALENLATSAFGLNIAIGKSAGSSITRGSRNIVIGNAAGSTNLSTPSSEDNILIGTGVDVDSNIDSNVLRIGSGSTYCLTGDTSTGDGGIGRDLTVGRTLFLPIEPDNNDASTQILTWDSGAGEVKYRNVDTIYSGGSSGNCLSVIYANAISGCTVTGVNIGPKLHVVGVVNITPEDESDPDHVRDIDLDIAGTDGDPTITLTHTDTGAGTANETTITQDSIIQTTETGGIPQNTLEMDAGGIRITEEGSDPSFIDLSCSECGMTLSGSSGTTIISQTGVMTPSLTLNGVTITSAADFFTGNTSGTCINELWVSSISGCSPVTIGNSIQSPTSTASGEYSIAYGNENTAKGDYSATIGGDTNIIGYSFSGGTYSSENFEITFVQTASDEVEVNYVFALPVTSYKFELLNNSGTPILPNISAVVDETGVIPTVINSNYGVVAYNFSIGSLGAGSGTLCTITFDSSVDDFFSAPYNGNILASGRIVGDDLQTIGGTGNGGDVTGDGAVSILDIIQMAQGLVDTDGFGGASANAWNISGGTANAAGNMSGADGVENVYGLIYIILVAPGTLDAFLNYEDIVGAIDSSVIVGGENNLLRAPRSVIIGGQNITGCTENTAYVPHLNIHSNPYNDNTLTQILARHSDGSIKYRESSSMVSNNFTLPTDAPTINGQTMVGFPSGTVVWGFQKAHLGVQSISGNTVVGTNSMNLVTVSGITVTLQAPSATIHGTQTIIKAMVDGVINIDSAGGGTIDGHASVLIDSLHDYGTFICDDTDWYVIGGAVETP